MGALRRHLSYANVMATLATFLALGGGAYAVTVPRDSVGPRQLKRNAVTSAKLKRGAVTSAKVRDRSLTTRDFAASALPGLAGARADDTNPAPAPGAVVRTATVDTTRAGRLHVLATVTDPYLTCGTAPCAVVWGVYVDGRAVPDTGLALAANPGEGDGRSYHSLFGPTAAALPAGRHTIVLARSESGGVDTVGELDAQLGALALGG